MELTIILKPSLESTLKDMGYEAYDHYNLDDVLFQQGYDMDSIEVSPNEDFEISDEWEAATLQCDDESIKFIDLKDEDSFEGDNSHITEDDYQIDLPSGHYIFHDDAKTIERIR